MPVPSSQDKYTTSGDNETSTGGIWPEEAERAAEKLLSYGDDDGVAEVEDAGSEPDAGDSDEDAGDGGDSPPEVIIGDLELRYTCDHFGMAEFFVDTYGSRVRWDEGRQRFMVYFPALGRWRCDGKSHEQVTRMARILAKAVHGAAEAMITDQDRIDRGGNDRQAREAAERRVNRVLRWYRVFQGTGNMHGIISAIQPTAMPCRPADFDRQPHLMNFVNGTYDVTTGRLRHHDEVDLITHQVATPLRLELAQRPLPEVAPHFSSLLDRMCSAPGEVSDEVAQSRREAVKRLAGCGLHGSNPEKRMGVFQGATQVGKSQFIEVIGTILGPELAWLSARPQLVIKSKGDRHDTEESDLEGRRIVLVNELLQDQVLDDGQVLRFVNPEGTLVALRRMRENRFDTPITWMMVVTTNELPKGNITPQVATRLLIFQLSKTEIPEHERYDIKSVILAEEPEAVLAHAVSWWREWWLAWRDGGSGTGLIVPVESHIALGEYRDANRHPAEQFIEERVIIDPDSYIVSTQAWEFCDAYYRTQHSDKDRRYLGGRRKFFELLSEVPGVVRAEKKRGTRSPLLLGFHGISIITPQDEELRLLQARGSGYDDITD